MTKILYIIPVGTDLYDKLCWKAIKEVKRPDVEAEVVHLKSGPPHVEYHYYEHICMDETLQLVRKAEKEGYDAVILGCFYDPGLREAREIVKMPVIGMAETSCHIASMLGHRFSILVGRRKCIPKMEDNVHLYGLEKNLASFRSLELNPVQMAEDPERLKEAITREARKAVEEDGAEVVVLGCGAQSGLVKELIKDLKLPVIDPVPVAWKYAEMMADLYKKLGLTQSKLYGYEAPPREDGWLK